MVYCAAKVNNTAVMKMVYFLDVGNNSLRYDITRFSLMFDEML